MPDGKNETPEYRAAIKKLRAWHENREVADRERVTPLRVLMMAARFRPIDHCDLPTYFDSRLRMSYMCDTLNPQGSDYQKALLHFANSVQVTEENIREVQKDLLITLANAAAIETPAVKTDKPSMEGRMAWELEMVTKLKDEAEYPAVNRKFWTECDEPFQFLAALREYYEIFVWCCSTVARVPNGRDATNSGS
ncbi:DNA-directed RNA polymerase [Synechococcus sp. RS9916]|nr:DNA-directed RNA polymerase [Synechococcus sp. RS9916]